MMDLNQRLLDAHAAGDKRALVTLYAEAAGQAPTLDSACYFLTQAYVFGLETAHPDTPTLRARLAEHGRV